jgi:ATP-dependent DNA helicase RecG
VSFEGRDSALRRLAFDELLALQLGMVARRRQRGRDAAKPIPVGDPVDIELRGALEGVARAQARARGSLTTDQDAAIGDIRSDLARPTPMLRLLQGDVGSGKTAVAAYALAAAARAGLQGALLAPTDLLARQHHRTLASLLEDAAIPVELLTGSLTAGRGAEHPGPRGVGPGAGRRRDARAHPGRGLVRRARGRRHRRAAPIRRRAARQAGGEGGRRPARRTCC